MSDWLIVSFLLGLVPLITPIGQVLAQAESEPIDSIPPQMMRPRAGGVDTGVLRSGYALLTDITIEGNRKTQRGIVEREMSLRLGDTIRLAELEAVRLRQVQLLLNTGLFSQVEILVMSLDTSVHTIALRTVVRERWYLYPSATVDLADRNFNVWWTEQNRDLSRVNFGFKLRHRNITGRADRLSLSIQSGYTRKAEIVYTIPYIDRARVLGLDLGYLIDRNREWAVQTVDGDQTFFGSDTAAVLKRRRYRIGLTLRPRTYLSHLLQLEHQVTQADSSLATDANPNFFGNGAVEQRYSGLLYRMTYDRRDVRPFPLRGDYVRLLIHKRGMSARDDLNRFELWLGAAHYQPFGTSRFNLALEAKGKYDITRTRVPYFNRMSLGFGEDFLRGYQYYVVDGLDFAFAKTTLRAQLFDQRVLLPFMPAKMLQAVPLRIFAGVHYDVGGARDPYRTSGNILANQILNGYGVGIYANVYYGQVLALELSHNQLGDWGWYFSFSAGI